MASKDRHLTEASSCTSGPSNHNEVIDRRSMISSTAVLASTTVLSTSTGLLGFPQASNAEITNDSLWPALPVAPYARRRTIRIQVAPGVWIFDQLIGIYYVHVPIRMTVLVNDTNNKNSGLFVYAPVAPTRECLQLLDELIDEYGPVTDILLPTVAVEHKVNAGPFARQFPQANFYVTDRQYSFPIPLPSAFLGLPSWTQTLPTTTNNGSSLFGDNIVYKLLTVKPGPGSEFQDVALLHRSSKTLLVCDVVFVTTDEPPTILTDEPEYTRALLFHARDSKDEVVVDTPENRRKRWRRIVLLFHFFFPGSGIGNLGLGPVLDALQTPGYKDGWGGWKPVEWRKESTVQRDFDALSGGGSLTMLPIIQIILARGVPDPVNAWVDSIVTEWKFDRIVPAHLDAPLAMGPKEFASAFDFARTGRNEVRFCDEDVEFLRSAEEGFLSFSVYSSILGPLRGRPCGLRD